MPLPNFNRADVIAIEKFATTLQRKSAYGAVPTKLHVGGIDVPIRLTTPDRDTSEQLGETELRAIYSTTLNEIQIGCSGKTFLNSDAAKNHIVSVIGHEALHAIQRQNFSKDEIDQASELSKKAKKEKETPNAHKSYDAYINCKVEFPAHAMMIALALRNEAPLDFVEEAKNTNIYEYFSVRLGDSENGIVTLVNLVKAALEMHKELMPPQLSCRPIA